MSAASLLLDRDGRVRLGAFAFLAEQTQRHGDVFSRTVLAEGFEVDGTRVPLIGPLGHDSPPGPEAFVGLDVRSCQGADACRRADRGAVRTPEGQPRGGKKVRLLPYSRLRLVATRLWGLSPHGVRSVVREVVDRDLWTATGNALQPTGRSNAFYGTGLLRASASRTPPWVAP